MMKKALHPILVSLRPLLCSVPFTVFLTLFLILLGALFIGMGSYCVDKCDIEDGRIGIYLLINGITLVIVAVFRALQYVLQLNRSETYAVDTQWSHHSSSTGLAGEEPQEQVVGQQPGGVPPPVNPPLSVVHESLLVKLLGFFLEVLSVFLMVWFIIGCLWVYRSHGIVQHDKPHIGTYCGEDCFNFTFWVLNVHFILIGIAVIVAVAAVVLFVWRERKDYA